MRKIKLFFRAVAQLIRYYEEFSAWNNADLQWTEQDALGLSYFLGNTCGKRLSARLRFASLEHNRSAVQDGEKHRCGIAAGYMLAINDIQMLSQAAIDSDALPLEGTNDNVVSFGPSGDLSHLAQ